MYTEYVDLILDPTDLTTAPGFQPNGGWPIVAVDLTGNMIAVTGDASGFRTGTPLRLVGSTGNDGVYSVVSVRLAAGPTTVLGLTPTLPDATADGNAFGPGVVLAEAPGSGRQLVVVGVATFPDDGDPWNTNASLNLAYGDTSTQFSAGPGAVVYDTLNWDTGSSGPQPSVQWNPMGGSTFLPTVPTGNQPLLCWTGQTLTGGTRRLLLRVLFVTWPDTPTGL